MKSKFLFLLALSMLLCSCNTNKGTSNVSGNSGDNTSTAQTSKDIDYDDDDDYNLKSISLDKSKIVLEVGKKYTSLIVNFNPSTVSDIEKEGVWASDNEAIATVRFGIVTGVSQGRANITYTTNIGKRIGICSVIVVNSTSDIVEKYEQVDDANSFAKGDEIIFGEPNFGVVASLDRVSGYLKAKTATFSSNKREITSFPEDTAEFYLFTGTESECFNLYTESGFLSGKETERSQSVGFVPSKGAINWLFEKPEGYTDIYCVNGDIINDYWLMFNKINSSDIRFNLYDSNPTELMSVAKIFRKTYYIGGNPL